MKQLDVVGVRVEMPANQPIVLLREKDGQRYLPIWIGAVEATAIAFAQQGVVPARPLTHDLFRDVVAALGHTLETVNITALRDGVFYADLVFAGGAQVSARPSDSIALALRTGATIFVSDEVLDEAGIDIPDEQEDEVERFREFLDQITPEDFEAMQESGSPPADPPAAPGGPAPADPGADNAEDDDDDDNDDNDEKDPPASPGEPAPRR